jgi:hypothetical protein
MFKHLGQKTCVKIAVAGTLMFISSPMQSKDVEAANSEKCQVSRSVIQSMTKDADRLELWLSKYKAAVHDVLVDPADKAASKKLFALSDPDSDVSSGLVISAAVILNNQCGAM